ncbi:ankyrin repeat-containing protein [Cyclospora cayetanensis]|uniref:Ankyrin repeat-containing protein n=1 Tax=Cyclospora cayetanensis TaxID=88456 RepID=A0A1D3CTG8_9EIME|nr:ankyrin repeat-containing protein [Cyclospora cayetanensis]
MTDSLAKAVVRGDADEVRRLLEEGADPAAFNRKGKQLHAVVPRRSPPPQMAASLPMQKCERERRRGNGGWQRGGTQATTQLAMRFVIGRFYCSFCPLWDLRVPTAQLDADAAAAVAPLLPTALAYAGACLLQRDKGLTALMHAVCGCQGDPFIVRQVLSAKGCDALATDKENNNALHWAATLGQTGVITLLLNRGVPREALNAAGGIPLFGALSRSEAALPAEAALSLQLSATRAAHSATLPFWGVRLFCLRQIALSSRLLSAAVEILNSKKFTAAGCVDNEGNTPLHTAAEEASSTAGAFRCGQHKCAACLPFGLSSLMKLLQEAGFSMETPNMAGATPATIVEMRQRQQEEEERQRHAALKVGACVQRVLLVFLLLFKERLLFHQACEQQLRKMYKLHVQQRSSTGLMPRLFLCNARRVALWRAALLLLQERGERKRQQAVAAMQQTEVTAFCAAAALSESVQEAFFKKRFLYVDEAFLTLDDASLRKMGLSASERLRFKEVSPGCRHHLLKSSGTDQSPFQACMQSQPQKNKCGGYQQQRRNLHACL